MSTISLLCVFLLFTCSLVSPTLWNKRGYGGQGGYGRNGGGQGGGGYYEESSDEGYERGSTQYRGGFDEEGSSGSEEESSYSELYSGIREYSSEEIFSSGYQYFLKFGKELFVDQFFKFKFFYESEYKVEFKDFFRYFMENSKDYRGVRAFKYCMLQYGFYGVFGDKIRSSFREYIRNSGSFRSEFDDDTTFEAMVKFASNLDIKDFNGNGVVTRFHRYCLRWGININLETSRKLFEGKNRYMTYQFFKLTHRSSSELKYGFAFKDCMKKYGISGYISGLAFRLVQERLGDKIGKGEQCDDMDCFKQHYSGTHGKVQNYFKRYCQNSRRSSGFFFNFSEFFKGFFNIFNLSFNYEFTAYFDYTGQYIKDCNGVNVCKKCFHEHAKNSDFFKKATNCFDRQTGRSR